MESNKDSDRTQGQHHVPLRITLGSISGLGRWLGAFPAKGHEDKDLGRTNRGSAEVRSGHRPSTPILLT